MREPDVRRAAWRFFNYWSRYLVSDPSKVWIGLEYFCNDTDGLWRMPDERMTELAVTEAERIGVAARRCAGRDGDPHGKACSGVLWDLRPVLRDPRVCGPVRQSFLVGRNGMHKYNKPGPLGADGDGNIVEGRVGKNNIWSVNTDMEYPESREEIPEEATMAASAGR
jgi:hypothetical protein